MAKASTISEIDRVSLPSRSMSVSTPIYTLSDGTLVFGLRQPPILPATGDVSIDVASPEENRLDLIAQQLLGSAASWWAIADVSGVLDPFAGVPTGTTLRVPSAQRLP